MSMVSENNKPVWWNRAQRELDHQWRQSAQKGKLLRTLPYLKDIMTIVTPYLTSNKNIKKLNRYKLINKKFNESIDFCIEAIRTHKTLKL